MARNTFSGYLRVHGGKTNQSRRLGGPTPAVLPAVLQVPGLDPTAASAGTGAYLPKGAIVTDVVVVGAATGGASPTVDVGTSADPDGFSNEQAADSTTSALAAGNLGAEAYSALAADAEVFAGVGASAATGGTYDLYVYYVAEDDAALQD